MNEEKILQFMKALDLTREEAIELIQEDEEIDKMTVKETENDLTPEQKKAIKKIKGGAKAVDAYGKKRNVQRKADDDKIVLMDLIIELLNQNGYNSIQRTKEGQLDFKKDDRRLRIVLSAPRK